MSEWSSGKIISTGFVSHAGPDGYEIHFKTPDRKEYRAVEEECRRQIGHAKPCTNAGKIRAMTDEELANFMICVAQRGGKPTNSGLIRWIDWLKQEATK